ncbi:MAG: glycosyltransferase family 4 protein [Spirochaetaceae bacterium]|jgi:glycosyltransferase involved in cell wall biosynthesis|nr:glycosyltransferase family 4 protein [Spirochaetaceae bacterium]
MKIAVDCRHIFSSGIGVYLEGCLQYFAASGNEFVLIGKKDALAPYLTGSTELLECSIKPFDKKELICFPRSILKTINSCDFYFSPYFNIPQGIKIPAALTIHDIIFLDMKNLVSRAGLAARAFFYKRAAKKSTVIFTVSNFSKLRIAAHLKTKNIIVTYTGIRRAVLEYKEKRKKTASIVYVGNVKKHKGLSVLISAFNSLLQEGFMYRLYIAGSKENFRSKDSEILKQTENNGAVVWTGSIPDEALCGIIAEASLLVQPSLYEGFGLPPLEALYLGTNALISDIPVFREIYGDFPVTFFKTGDAEDLKRKMRALLPLAGSSTELGEELKSRYTFKKTADIILGSLKQLK